MPSAWRGSSLVPEEEWERNKEAEREARLARFTRGAGVSTDAPRSREPISTLANYNEDEEFEPVFRDRHAASDSRAALVEALNSRS